MCDMRKLCFLCLQKVLHQNTGGGQPGRKILKTESGKRIHPKVFHQAFPAAILVKIPWLKRVDRYFQAFF